MRHAVIAIGSNSTRMLIGDIAENGAMTPIVRMREGTRVFAGLENGMLSEKSMAETADAVERLMIVAHGHQSETFRLIATSASRDAKNSDALKQMVEARAGIPLQIISGEEEARLSFLGAAGNGYCGMIDIGGGSTELAVGGGGRPFAGVSAQLGAVRLLEQAPDTTGAAYEALRAQAIEALCLARQGLNTPHLPVAWFGVGGTMTCLASLDMRLPAFDREAIEGHALKKSQVDAWALRLWRMPLEERAALPGMVQHRADIIAHGAVILSAVMEALNIARVVVTGRTNLDGMLREISDKLAVESRVEQVRAFYDASVEAEWTRLERHAFEFEINRRYIDRYVKSGDRVLDVGGGPGRYSLYLAARGVDVTLFDLSPGNVAFAKERAQQQGLPLSALCGDARQVDEIAPGEYDAILLMGPLYHLTEEADRVRTVEACLRRLKPGGVLFVAFISMIGGMVYAARSQPDSILWEGEEVFYEKVIAGEDYAGQAFTQAYFIAPDNVDPFMARFPLHRLHLVASEGITAPFETSLADQPADVRAKWLSLSLALCEREDFRNFAEHFLYIGRKKEENE